MITPAKRIESVQEYYFSSKLREIAERRSAGEDIINLGIGSPDLPPHPSVVKALSESASQPQNHGYQSYRGLPKLREGFAQWYRKKYGVSLDPNGQIIPLMGSKEGIMHVSMALLNPGDHVLVPNPGYPTYSSASAIAGARILPYTFDQNRPGWPELEKFDAATLKKTKIMWINYPHMPTGVPGSLELFDHLVSFAKKHEILLCHDNPYNDLLNENTVSIFQIEGAMDCAIELNSLSKTFNMAGWRVGVLSGNAELLDIILRFKTNMDSGMFLPVQEAAAAALILPDEWMRSLNNQYAVRQNIAIEIMKAVDATPLLPQSGLFVWAKAPNGYADSADLTDQILDECGVFIVPGKVFGTAGIANLRISLCSPESKLSEALHRIKTQLKL